MISGLLRRSTHAVRNVFVDFREFISPSLCLGCDGDIDSIKSFFCDNCRQSLLRENPGQGPVCPFCAPSAGVAGSCLSCVCPDPLRLFFWGAYDGLLKDSIIRFKFKGVVDLGKELTEMAVDALSSRLSQRKYDLIIPVPLHKSRQRKREYNQSEIIAGLLAERLNAEMNTGILIRVRRTGQQAKLAENDRWKNVKDAFAVAREIDLSEKSILLVDDIVTTGATVFEASRPLQLSGARNIDLFSLAFTL